MKRICFFILFLLIVFYANAQSSNQAPVITVTIPVGQIGYPVPSEFPGFSYEVSSITGGNYLNIHNIVLIQMIKNLGAGILRIGGNSSDNIYWANHPRNADTGKDSLTTTDIDNFSAFAKATGWRVLFGLNLGDNNPQAAASEAQYVEGSLQNLLYAFQIGNEPDLFTKLRPDGYSYSAFQTEWEAYHQAITKLLPAVPFGGPDIANKSAWVTSFASAEESKVILIDGHHYHTSGKFMAPITFQTILAPDTNLTHYLQVLHTASDMAKLPYRISEGNSISRGGKLGVSNVFAGGLWTLDFMWTVAENKGLGVNFHGGSTSHYAPIVMINGIPSPRPAYYAMLAFKYGTPGGTILQTELSKNNYNCTAYVCLNNGSTFFTLINKDTNDIVFSVPTGKGSSSIEVARLIAPNITSTEGVTFAGSEISPDGSFKPTVKESYRANNKNILITVPAGSAAVVSIK